MCGIGCHSVVLCVRSGVKMMSYFLVLAILAIIAGIIFLIVAINYIEERVWEWALRKWRTK